MRDINGDTKFAKVSTLSLVTSIKYQENNWWPLLTPTQLSATKGIMPISTHIAALSQPWSSIWYANLESLSPHKTFCFSTITHLFHSRFLAVPLWPFSCITLDSRRSNIVLCCPIVWFQSPFRVDISFLTRTLRSLCSVTYLVLIFVEIILNNFLWKGVGLKGLIFEFLEKMKIQCDVCEKAPATVICCADEAALCAKCDVEIHAANKLASKHQRLLLQCLSNKLPRCDICQVCQSCPTYSFYSVFKLKGLYRHAVSRFNCSIWEIAYVVFV